jgi:Uma2 family endonuclease
VIPYGGPIISNRATARRLIPDVAVVTRAAIRAANQNEILALTPVVAVVVVSSESAGRLEEKTRDYLAHGAHSVWTLYPQCREVFVRHADGNVRILSGDQILEDDALPGFRVAVSAFFEDVNG